MNRRLSYRNLFWKGFQASIFFLAVSLQLSGQGTIRGTILDRESREPVSGATVHLSPPGRFFVSDPRGKFSVDVLEARTYVVEVRFLGYMDFVETVPLKEGQTVELEVFLSRESRNIEGIEVMGAQGIGPVPVQAPFIRSEIFHNQLIESSATDIGTYIRSVPNVSGIRKGGSTLDPVVRGFKYSQLNVQLNDGQKIEGGCPNRMDPTLSHVEIEDLEGLEILKGPYSLRYGPATGGIINLQTPAPVFNDHFHVSGSALLGYSSNPSGTKAHLNINGSNRKFYFGLSGNHKQNKNYQDGRGNTVKAESHKFNIKGQAGLAPGKHHLILLTYNHTVGKDISFPALPMDTRKDITRLMSADYTWDAPSPKLFPVVVKLYRSDVDHTMDNEDRTISDTMLAVTRVRAVNSGARAETGFRPGRWSVRTGLDYEYITKDGDRVKTMVLQPSTPTYTEQIWNNAVIDNLGIFAEFRRPTSRIDAILSVRADYNYANSDDITFEKMGSVIYFSDENQSDHLNLSVSAGAEFHLTDSLSLSLSLGRGVRSPDMTERFITLLPVGYDNYDYLGNPQLDPEANHQADLTCRFSDHRLGNLEINGFCSIVTNYITGRIIPPSEQKPATNGVIGVKKYYNADKAFFRGFEFAYGSPATIKWYIQWIAAYTRATIGESVRHVVDSGGQVTGTETIQNDPLSEIPPFETTFTVGYKFMKGKLIPKVKARYVARQGYVSKAFYEKPTPDFFVGSLSCSYFHNQHFTLTAGIDNVFDNAYFEHLNRRVIGSAEDIYEPGINVYLNLIFRM